MFFGIAEIMRIFGVTVSRAPKSVYFLAGTFILIGTGGSLVGAASLWVLGAVKNNQLAVCIIGALVLVASIVILLAVLLLILRKQLGRIILELASWALCLFTICSAIVWVTQLVRFDGWEVFLAKVLVIHFIVLAFAGCLVRCSRVKQVRDFISTSSI
jgi:hypothetical protein